MEGLLLCLFYSSVFLSDVTVSERQSSTWQYSVRKALQISQLTKYMISSTFVESLCKDLPVIRPPYELSMQLCGGVLPRGEFTPCQKQRIFHWPRAEWVFQNCLARLLTVSFKILLMFSGSLVCLKSSCQWCLQCLSPLRSSDPKMVNCVPWSDIYSLRFSSWLIIVKREVSYSSRHNLWH